MLRDTGTRRIDVFDFDAGPERSRIGEPRRRAGRGGQAGRPDRRRRRRRVAGWGGSAFITTPGGQLEQVIRLPVSLTTKPAFGGPALDDLYVTSAWIALTDEQRSSEPEAGGVFHCRPGVRGRAANRFAG